MRGRNSGWFVCSRPNPNARIRLFCFSFAGGGASLYSRWGDVLPDFVEVTAVQLPGHETRISEAPFTDLTSLLTALGDAFLDQMDRSFAIFGHSLGALISFELARLLRRDFRLLPAHLFLSGLRPVQLPDFDQPIHGLSPDEALRELQARYGLPPPVLADPELQRLFIPVLQADFAIFETYVHRPEAPLDCAVTVFGGSDDRKVDSGTLHEWQRHTTKPLRLHILPGDHFFIESCLPELSRLLSEELSTHLLPDMAEQ
jgi:medium-chain acyl-[acyl-carrier-protein] hydrolase